MSVEFPDPRQTSPEGLVAVGGDLGVETLLTAYRQGIFPWPQEGYPMLWFCPPERGVLDFADFHVPESLRKHSRRYKNWRYTLNTAFEKVIRECSKQKRPNQDGTWILPDMEKAYLQLFKEGYIQCLECWDGLELIGGLYGVLQNAVFSGESMFFRKPNASKMCLWKMVEHLQSLGHTWMDIQMITPVTAAFGGKYISRHEFLKRIGI